MSSKYIEHCVDKLIKDGKTRVEALVFMREVTSRRLNSLTFDDNAKVIDRIVEDLETIDKMLKGEDDIC